MPAAIPLTPGIAETGSKEKFGSAAYVSPSRTSFWRTRNGIITIVVIALVIVGAVVGGAVGGTVGKKSNNKSLGGPTATGSDSSPSVAAVQPTSATINQGIGGADASQTAASASTTSPPLLSDGSGRPTSSLSGSGTFSLPFATSSIPAAGGAAVASDPSGGSEIVQQNS